METTILMPCLNEEETIGTCIKKAQQAILQDRLDAEILIVDNGSTDRSVDIARELGARVVFAEQKGYGNTLRAGIAAAYGKFIVMADSDDSYDFTQIGAFIVKLRLGYDLVMGNRFKGGIEPYAMPFLHRYLGNPVLSFLGRKFFDIPIGDFHCGFRGFSREAVMDIDLQTTGMEFASEMIIKSSLYLKTIVEIPVKLHPDGRSRPPHLRTWHDGWRHLRFLLLFSPRWLFLYPGYLMMLLGGMVSLALLPKPLTVGNITFDVHTILYSVCLVFIGFQCVSFYCLTQVYAAKRKFSVNNAWVNTFKERFTLERGIGIGLLLLFIGACLTASSMNIWTRSSFGDVQPSRLQRLIIPAIASAVIGMQFIFNSFFISILDLKTSSERQPQALQTSGVPVIIGETISI